MKKLLPLLLIIFSLAFPATRTWSSAGSTDMNDAANYSGAGALLTTDSLVFNATSVINATATGALSVKSVTTASNYSGNWSDGAQNISATANISFAHSGTLTLSKTVITGSAGAADGFAIANTVGTCTIVACTLDMRGTGNLSINKAGGRVGKLICGATGKTTTITGSATASGFNQLSVGAGTLTINSTTLMAPVLTSGFIVLAEGYTVNGNSTFSVGTFASSTYTFPAMTIGGTVSFWIRNGYTAVSPTIQLSGNISCGSFPISQEQATSLIVNTANYNITTGTYLAWGSNSATGTMTVNLGSSTVTIGTNWAAPSYNGAGGTTWNLGTSSVSVGGNIVKETNHVFNHGTSAVTVTGNSTITMNGDSLYDLTINALGATVSSADDLNLSGDLTLTAGTLNISGDDVTVGADMTLPIDYSWFTVTATAASVTSTSTNRVFVITEDAASFPAQFWSSISDAGALDVRVYDSTNTVEYDRVIYGYTASTSIEIYFVAPATDSGVSLKVTIRSGGATAANDALPAAYLGYWPMGNVSDISTNANTLTNVSSTPFEAGKLGNAAHFDGTADNLYTDILTPFATMTSGTISWWEYADVDNGLTEYTLQFTKAASANTQVGPFTRFVDSTSPQIDTELAQCYVDATQNWAYSLGDNWYDTRVATWVHFTLIHNGTAPILCANGVSQTLSWLTETDKTKWLKAAITDATTKADRLTFGGRYTSGTFNAGFDGLIDNVQIINETWTANDALMDYNCQNNQATFWTCGAFNVGGTLTTDGSSTLTFTGASTITTNGKALPQTTINGATTINDGCTIARLIYGTDGITATFEAGQNFTITALTNSNWDGAAANRNVLHSSTPGTRFRFTLPNSETLAYVEPKDNALIGYSLYAIDGTSYNAGNDSGWVFAASFDTTYRDTVITDTVILSCSQHQRIYGDSAQIDSIVGVDTTLNWGNVFRDSLYYDTLIVSCGGKVGTFSNPDYWLKPHKNDAYRLPVYKRKEELE